jgi:amino-acid N-acetyltransferase
MTTELHTIRPAEFHDAEAIFALIKTYPEELLPRSISDIVQNVDRFLVAVVDDEVVGTASWQILPEIGAPRQPSVEIKSLAVQDTHRGNGIGRDLVASAIERIRLLNPAQIIVLTFTPEFFARIGFNEISKKDLMHKIYMGCINCAKYDSPFTCPETAMAMKMDDS